MDAEHEKAMEGYMSARRQVRTSMVLLERAWGILGENEGQKVNVRNYLFTELGDIICALEEAKQKFADAEEHAMRVYGGDDAGAD